MPPHCDSIDGAVVNAAIRAFDERSVELVLPFVGGWTASRTDGPQRRPHPGRQCGRQLSGMERKP
jgi:hypothetical protein